MKLRLKPIIYGVSTGVVAIALIVGMQIYTNAQGIPSDGSGSSANLLTTQSSSAPTFELSPKNRRSAQGQSLGTASEIGGGTIKFRNYGTAIIDTLTGYGNSYFDLVYAGFSSIPAPSGSGGSQFSLDGASTGVTLDVNGAIQIDGLTGTGTSQLQSNDYGVLSRAASVGESGGNLPSATNGSCTTYGGSYSSQPATNTSNGCTAGTYANTPADTTGSWRWSCNGTNGGSTATCSANRTSGGGGQLATNGQCGSANGGAYSTPPSSNLCSAGNATSVISGPKGYTWSCNGTGGGSNDSCSAERG